jgi:hypothetical protein
MPHAKHRSTWFWLDSQSPRFLARSVLTIIVLFSADWTKRLTDSANSTSAGPFLALFWFEIYRQLAQEARRTHPPRNGQDRDQRNATKR